AFCRSKSTWERACRRAHWISIRSSGSGRDADSVDRASRDSASIACARRQSRVKLSHEVIPLYTRHPFVIARGGYAGHENVIVTIQDDDGLLGFGEAAPNRDYGAAVGSVVAAVGRFIPMLATA